MHGAGFSGTFFSDQDKGIGWWRGTSGIPVKMRTHYLTTHDAASALAGAQARMGSFSTFRPAENPLHPHNQAEVALRAVPPAQDITTTLASLWPTKTSDGSPIAAWHLDLMSTATGIDETTLRAHLDAAGITIERVSMYREGASSTRAGVRYAELPAQHMVRAA